MSEILTEIRDSHKCDCFALENDRDPIDYPFYVSIHIICDCMPTPNIQSNTVLIHIQCRRQNKFFRVVNDNKVSSVSNPLDHGVVTRHQIFSFFVLFCFVFSLKEYIRIFLLYKLEAHFRLERAETSSNTTGQQQKARFLISRLLLTSFSVTFIGQHRDL